MILPICPNCHKQQWSIMDKNYLKIYGHCWSCDKKEWEAKRLSTEEFEKREVIALKTQ